ncbi:MAG: protein-methionine-sulfoxide reductase heme-binding subunit MsrQ [Chromatiales bacterium]|jgi:sulfoxide reductase heme-binding subunit YedZ
MRSLRAAPLRWVKPAVFGLSLLPAAWLAFDAYAGRLGVNPIETVTHSTGDWTLRFILIALCVTPLRWLTGQAWILRLRRMLGLFAFFYACLHLTTYLWLDQFFIWQDILADIVKRPFITVGFASFVILAALAATSTDGMLRRLGRRWKTLHRGVYLAAILGVVHFWWLVKADIREPALYAGLLAVLLGYRVVRALRQRRRQTNRAAVAARG